ncbi:MAG: histidinol-phosphatase [Clostridia bacterium]|nr:histidinol-phosphatase [Clostridia bacterium]
MKANYHCHTPRCHHAVGSEEEYVQAAIDAGFDVLGFSDHAPWPYRSGYQSGIRMGMDELSGYLDAVRRVKDQFRDDIVIHVGLEAEYFPRYRDHLHALLDQVVGYYLLGQHSIECDEDEDPLWTARSCEADDEMVLRFAERLTEGMRTGLYACVAHPDIYMRRRLPGDFSKACEQAAEMIAQCAMEMDIPLEYNLLGRKYQLEGEQGGYPNMDFWLHISRYPVRTIVGVDAHHPQLLREASLWEEGHQALRSLGFTVMDRLPMDA